MLKKKIFKTTFNGESVVYFKSYQEINEFKTVYKTTICFTASLKCFSGGICLISQDHLFSAKLRELDMLTPSVTGTTKDYSTPLPFPK